MKREDVFLKENFGIFPPHSLPPNNELDPICIGTFLIYIFFEIVMCRFDFNCNVREF